MVIVRFLGRIFVLLGFAALALGVWLWLSGEDVTQSAGLLWRTLDFESLNGAQVVVQRYLFMPGLWDSGILPLLTRPAWEAVLWLFLGGMVLGGVLLLLGRGKKRRTSSFN